MSEPVGTHGPDDRASQMLEERTADDWHERRTPMSQWLQPQTVIAMVAALGTVYGSWVLQAERLEVMRARVDAIERDYQRRDVLSEQLKSIDERLRSIEAAVQADEQRHLRESRP